MDDQAALTGSFKASVLSGPWIHLLCSLAPFRAGLQLDVDVRMRMGSHGLRWALHQRLARRQLLSEPQLFALTSQKNLLPFLQKIELSQWMRP